MMPGQGTGRRIASLCALALACALAPASAAAAPPTPELVGVTPLGSDVVRYHYRYGPLTITPGQNLILIGPETIEKPAYDGYAIRVKPNLVLADGTVPDVDVIHLHHAVWVNMSRRDLVRPGRPERFFAAGEEKTIATLPPGYGYYVDKSDVWAINHMIHNQTASTETVWMTYDLDYVAADSPHGRRIHPVRPLWMDVRNGEAYPVFDVHRGSGGRDHRFTYPAEARNPYPDGDRLNRFRLPFRGTLVSTAGHVHPGGLWTDLALYRGHRRRHIFRSRAHYFDPRGPVSWDLSMTASKPNWRVGVRRGDELRLNATYESRRASWYESMGINLVWIARGQRGPNPFRRHIDTTGRITHGHLPENENYGGQATGAPDPRRLPDGQTLDNRVGIFNFQYLPGGAGQPGSLANPPVVAPGEELQFENGDAALAGMMHTVTSCRAPCNRSTGISYPLANGPAIFDSGNLGYGPEGFTAAANRRIWRIPKHLKPATYTYFCRIHPFMRGAFRVKRGG
jgi:hypothetical protein